MLRKLERKFGKYAIKNLTTYVIFTYLLGYLFLLFGQDLISYVILDPAKVLEGEIWRLFTWVLIPPTSLSVLTILTLYFYYTIGKSLEIIMGDFVYNLYIFGGIFISVLAFFISYFIFPMDITFAASPSTYWLCMSLYLAFAMTFPNQQVLFMFFIPVKMKWLALVYFAFIVVEFAYGNIVNRIMIVASLLNFIIYFLLSRKRQYIRPSEIKRKQQYKTQVKQHVNITRHKCAVCGRTERDGDLTFRFCSKCNGNYEYCSDHLYTHEHKL